MKIIPPRLWVTCRVIANTNRLFLLREIFNTPRQCVGKLAEAAGLTVGSTSNQLKILCSEGFITQHRLRQEVRYDDIIPYAPAHIKAIQTAIKKEFLMDLPLESVFKAATGPSHQRRIELMSRIGNEPRSMNELLEETVMSYSALSRHLRKLQSRNYISFLSGRYHVGTPASPLAKALLKLIT